jgi:enoyl-CoA hydratase/carnithine racemase
VNVLNEELWAGLEAALDALAGNVRGLIVVSAKPGVFIAGADLKLLADATGPGDPTVRTFIERGLRVLSKIESLPFPTCAAIDGAALGGGLEVALAFDCRIAGSSEKVKLGLPEVTLGLIPGWGGTQRLPRIIGLEVAVEMVVTGRADSGANAAVTGLVDRTVDSARLLDEAVALVLGCDRAAARSRKRDPIAETEFTSTTAPDSTAAREALRVMSEGTALPFADGMKLETEAFMKLAGSPESKQRIATFFGSRKK